MSKKVADIIVETLEAAGVRHCYGFVGDTFNLIAHVLSRSGIEWISMRHEEAGAFTAQWLAHPGPSLLYAKVESMTLVMPPAIEFGPAYGMALYSARAVLGGQTHDLIEMIKENVRSEVWLGPTPTRSEISRTRH